LILFMFSFNVFADITDPFNAHVYEVELNDDIVKGAYNQTGTLANTFFTSLQNLAKTNNISLVIDLNSGGELCSIETGYDTATKNGALLEQGIEVNIITYFHENGVGANNTVLELEFENVDPVIANPPVSAQPPNTLTQYFILEVEDPEDEEGESKLKNTIPVPNTFSLSTVNGLSAYFSPATLALLNVPLTSPLVAGEAEYEHAIERSATLNGQNMTLKLELSYESMKDLQSNHDPEVEIELIISAPTRNNLLSVVKLQNLIETQKSWISDDDDDDDDDDDLSVWAVVIPVAVLVGVLVAAIVIYFRIFWKRGDNSDRYQLVPEETHETV